MMDGRIMRCMTQARWQGLLVAVVAGAALGGCYEDDRYRYLAHSDTITMGAGDANASNIATQTVDPWPPESNNTRIDQDGKRAAIAIKRYETNTSIEPKGLTTSDVAPASNDGPAPQVSH